MVYTNTECYNKRGNLSFMEYKKFTKSFAKRELIIELGKTNSPSNGECWVTYGDTVVMTHVTMARTKRQDIDFFPLSVEYEEKFYAVGKIPGSFLKREGKPSENAILVARCIDRFIRPFFPKDMRNDVSVVCTVLSCDLDNSPEICAMLGVAVALSISDIPWNGPVTGINVGLVNDEIILNPTKKERENSLLDLTVAANNEKIAMIEAGAFEISEQKMLECIKKAHDEIKNIINFINKIKDECGKEKFCYKPYVIPQDFLDSIKEKYLNKIELALENKDKIKRDENIQNIVDNINEEYKDNLDSLPLNAAENAVYILQKNIIRNWLLKYKKRVDGRNMDEIRPLCCSVGFLPRVHGCAMFKRGHTQTMSVVTLGALSEEQRIDGLNEQQSKRYMHQYNFPSYSVGETKTSRAPGRREIGHGALAERALKPVIPSKEKFPYSIRVVSETLSSNGSTSQASICSSSLALMDAGVPIKAAVAGISCGLITSKNGEYSTILDIQGLEDFFGDMDFKVGGTKNGITAIQVDIKIDGITMKIIEEVFQKAKKAREHILDNVMAPVISCHRKELKEFTPKIEQIAIPTDKIKDVIGTNGKVIQKISSDFNVKIEIQDDGKAYILGIDSKNVNSAKSTIKTIITNPKVGEIFSGTVSRIMPFGAFVEIVPGKEGLLHISKLDFNRVNKVQDVVNIGDKVLVKVIEIDEQGRINLSRKDALGTV